ncbi:baseplate J/gp47 family protein [Bradyrhizobium diazoefficiens]|uniref:baseplate J/gp47 family protein n=1 Tax=Bradyrhizobium diazoefficiens TaxID=1355477 RepID=UPI002729E822|nr:baseplate J/gp47 family protein [Bradyrhizobium diazoefficiens]WLA69201.1 baseplate J/gp47 family protein [Bradyrhizobium diazoefficiens]
MGDKPAAVLLSKPPYLAVAGKRENLLWLDVANSSASTFNLFDRVDLTPPAQVDYVLLNVDGARRLERITLPDVVEVTSRAHYAVPKSSIEVGKKYRFLSVKSVPRGGKVGTSADELILDDQDTDTKQRNFVIIDLPSNVKLALRVKAVNSVGTDRIATLEANIPLPPTTQLSYVRATTQRNGGAYTTIAVPENVATLARVDVPRPGTKAFSTAAPADPAQQKVQASSGNWLVLHEAWTTQPLATTATLVGDFTEGTWSIEPLNRGYQNPELSWEYFDGHGWQRLVLGQDGTHNLAAGGVITFEVPADLAQTDVAGQTDYWIRARLIGGDYGHAKYIVATDNKNPSTQTITVDTSELHPPEILSISATFKLTDPAPAQIVLADNNGGMLDQTQAAVEKYAEFELFEGLLALDRFGAEEPLAGRALFLGFTKPFNVSSLSLYADAEEQDGEGALQAAVLAQRGWRMGRTDDETVGLRRRGFIRISALDVPVRAALFGQELYWLRLSLTSSDAAAATDWQPKVNGLYVNAVLVDQARSVSREMLGSSDGSPDQTYTLSGKPVLLRDGPGRTGAGRDGDTDIELRVREQLCDEDRAALAATPKGVVDDLLDLPGVWVLWRRVDSLLGAGSDERVFTLDATQGIVHFGDNSSGKIPPAGRDGICVFHYRQGGGVQGNVPAFAIKNLKTALESVDAAVNPIEAAGGLAAPTVDRIIARAPALLRHAGRAMSAADMEAFAVASSPDVARARLVMPREAGDAMQLAVAIRARDARPRPSRARAEALARYILGHASGDLDADALKVVPPDYVPLNVRVDLLATSADAVAGVDSAVRERLARFLHPTDGGPDGDGWPFARRAWPSDIDRVLSGIAGIDRVTNIEMYAERDLDDLPPTAMICADDINVEVTTGGPA